MATSGSVNTGSYDGRYYKFSWTASQSVANNQSTISWEIEALGGNDSWYAEYGVSASINGSSVYNKKYTADNRPKRYKGIVASGTKVITHDSNGDADLSISISAYIYGSSSSYLKTGSKTFELTNIPRKSTLSVGNGTLGTAQTLTVTRKSSSFTHTIVATCGGQSTTICSKSSSTSISFTPPLDWASENTTGTSLSVKYTITTYNGSTNIGSNNYTKTCSIPASVKPSCSVAVTDPTGYADTYGGYIKGLSKFKVVVTPTISYGSAIASYSTSANGSTYTASSFTTEVLKSSGSVTVAATVKDKRGRTGTAGVMMTVLDYTAPTISKLAVGRCNADGTENQQGEYCKVSFDAAITNLRNQNSAKYTLEYKKAADSGNPEKVVLTSLNGKYTVSGSEYIFAADSGSSYEVKIIATDDFDSVTRTTSVSTGIALMHWLSNGLGMAIGKIAELIGVFDIGFQTRFSGGILQPVLADGTDLNSVMTPNTYSGNSASGAGYLNCPFETGTSFSLEVMSQGQDGQLIQRITTCSKKEPVVYERFYYSKEWGDWLCVSNFKGKLLWSGAWYMHGTQTAQLSEAISKQPTGIVLVFSAYVDGTAHDYDFEDFFVSKYIVQAKNGCGHNFRMNAVDFSFIGTKYLYISDTTIKGYEDNDNTGTANGVTYANNHWVLRYVIGV